MTQIPVSTTGKKLGLVIDLDICVGCHACAVNCKEWNTSGHSAPLPDTDPFGANADGVWFNRVHTFECGDGADGRAAPTRHGNGTIPSDRADRGQGHADHRDDYRGRIARRRWAPAGRRAAALHEAV